MSQSQYPERPNDVYKIDATMLKPNISVPTMLTIKETAAYFKLSYFFVRRAVVNNKVVHVMTGKKYLVNAEKFAEWLNQGEFQCPEGPQSPNEFNGSNILDLRRIRRQA